MVDEKDDIQDKVDEMTTTSFNISGCPIKVFRRFLGFCERNAKNTLIFYKDDGTGTKKKHVKEQLCYAIALKQLLDRHDADAVNTMLYEKIINIEKRMEELEGKPEERKLPKTFGSRGRKDEQVK